MWDAVIIGLGETGFATASYLYSQGLKVAVTDNRQSPPLLARLKKTHPQISVHLGSMNTELLQQASKIIISPGICPQEPEIARIVELFGDKIQSDIDVFLEKWTRPVIAITGSNGKSTVLKMLHDILNLDGKKCMMIGNVGTPVLSLLEKEEKDHPAWVVMEISSFQLYWSKKIRCDYGAVINIYPNHLDWHRCFSEYVGAKLSLLAHSTHAFIDARSKNAVVEHGLEKEVCAIHYEVHDDADEDFFPRNLKENAQAASAIAKKIGIDQAVIKRALQEFQPWPYRCELASQEKGYWYNDAKSSNIAAAQHALSSINQKHGKKVVWIAGGIAKNESFQSLPDWAPGVVSHAICFGQDGHQFVEVLKGYCQVSPVNNLQEAVALAKQVLQGQEDVVVFSPAAASFDQFKNYKHRGLCFNELVQDATHVEG